MATVTASSRYFISFTEYLFNELRSSLKNEYVNGVVYAMAGVSEVHNILTGNIFFHLFSHLRNSSCKVFVSDMKIQIKTITTECFYYPDVVVSCDTADNHEYYKSKPLIIIEVLSESIARIDRGEKFYNYRQLDSLQEYVLIEQARRRVEIHARANQWQPAVCIDTVTFNAVNLTLSLDEIYERVHGVLP